MAGAGEDMARLEAALAAAPGDPGCLWELLDARIRVGERARAYATLRDFLARGPAGVDRDEAMARFVAHLAFRPSFEGRRGPAGPSAPLGNRAITALAVCPEGRGVAAGDAAGMVTLRDLPGPAAGDPVLLGRWPRSIERLEFEEGGAVLLVVERDGRARRVDLVGGAPPAVVDAPRDVPAGGGDGLLVEDPAGSARVRVRKGQLVVLDPEGAARATLRTRDAYLPRGALQRQAPAAALGPGGRVLLLGSSARQDPGQGGGPQPVGATLFLLEEKPRTIPLAVHDVVSAVATSPPGDRVFLGTTTGELVVYDLVEDPEPPGRWAAIPGAPWGRSG